MNDLDLCLEVVSRSYQPLRYIRRWIARKPLEIEAWFQMTTNRKWHIWTIKWSRWQVLWGSTVGYPSDSLASCIYMSSPLSSPIDFSCLVCYIWRIVVDHGGRIGVQTLPSGPHPSNGKRQRPCRAYSDVRVNFYKKFKLHDQNTSASQTDRRTDRRTDNLYRARQSIARKSRIWHN